MAHQRRVRPHGVQRGRLGRFPAPAAAKVRRPGDARRRLDADWWPEDIRPEGGTAPATYADGLLRGRAAVVANAHGAGRVVYFATPLEREAFDRAVLDVVEGAGVTDRFRGLPAHLECTVREDERDEYLFLLNHDAEASVTVPLEDGGTDLLTGLTASGEITMSPLGAAVVRRTRRA